MASGIIQVTLLLLAMGLALLPFFQFFRGTPHQLAAIKQLEESMPAELLEEHEADWFQAWKESGYDQQIFMPYFKQLDNETGTGYRECFSSAAAMVAAFYKKVRTDDEYNKIRAKYGDTTSVEAQIAALESLGLKAEFRKDGDADMVELEIEGWQTSAGWLVARWEHASWRTTNVQWPGLWSLERDQWLCGQEQQRSRVDHARSSRLSRDGEGWSQQPASGT